MSEEANLQLSVRICEKQLEEIILQAIRWSVGIVQRKILEAVRSLLCYTVYQG